MPKYLIEQIGTFKFTYEIEANTKEEAHQIWSDMDIDMADEHYQSENLNIEEIQS